MKTAQLTSFLGRGRRPRLNRMWNFAGPRHFHVLVDVASCLLNLANDLVTRTDEASRKYWKLVKSLATERYELLKKLQAIKNSIEKSCMLLCDVARESIKEERELRKKAKRERVQAK